MDVQSRAMGGSPQGGQASVGISLWAGWTCSLESSSGGASRVGEGPRLRSERRSFLAARHGITARHLDPVEEALSAWLRDADTRLVRCRVRQRGRGVTGEDDFVG